MKKELQELGLLNTKTLTKLVFYNERLAFLCRSDRSRGVSSALSWYPSVVARTWCKNDKVSWRGLKTVVNLPQKSETKKQGYEDKEQCYCKSGLQSDMARAEASRRPSINGNDGEKSGEEWNAQSGGCCRGLPCRILS